MLYWKLFSVSNCQASSCFGIWLQNYLVTFRIVLQLEHNYS